MRLSDVQAGCDDRAISPGGLQPRVRFRRRNSTPPSRSSRLAPALSSWVASV